MVRCPSGLPNARRENQRRPAAASSGKRLTQAPGAGLP
jgi:hypothetical protein